MSRAKDEGRLRSPFVISIFRKDIYVIYGAAASR
jgi:hypothetical protein